MLLSAFLLSNGATDTRYAGTQAKPATAALLKQLEQKLARGGGGRLVIVRDGDQLVLTLG